MSLREFQYVIAIAEEGSISKAARRLHIAQPSLSLYLQRLEQRLETPLFDRNTIPMTLTSAGELYVGKARKILGLEQELHRELHDMSDMKKGHVTLGMTVYWSLRFLPKVLPVFHSLYPGIGIGIREQFCLVEAEPGCHRQCRFAIQDATPREHRLVKGEISIGPLA